MNCQIDGALFGGRALSVNPIRLTEDAMKIICIVNNSRGSLEIDYPGGKLSIPGHCFESDPFCAEVPDEVVEGIIASVERQPAYVYMGGDVEAVETPDDDNLDGNPDDNLRRQFG